MIHAVQPFHEDIAYTAGDVVPVILAIYQNAVAFNMTGMTVDIDILDKTGTALRSLSSAGTSPAITISVNELTITTTAFTTEGRYNYDLQITNGAYVYTIGKGNWIVNKQTTT